MAKTDESRNSENGTLSTEKKPSFFSRFIKKYPLTTTILFGLLALVVVYFAKDFEGNLKKKNVEKQAAIQLLEKDRTMLKLVSKPLVWNVRSEMLRSNLDQIDLLMTNLVKEKNFQYIHLVNMDGGIILSTDKKMEGKSIENGTLWNAFLADTTVVLSGKENLITVVAPVMGYDDRMGTLVIAYQAAPFISQKKK